MSSEAAKRIFLVVSGDEGRRAFYRALIENQVENVTIYEAEDGSSAWAKASNVPPHVLITEVDLPKLSGAQLMGQVFQEPKLLGSAIVVIGQLPKEAAYLDEFVTGRLQYYATSEDEKELAACVTRALNFAFHRKNTEYRMRFLAEGERLISEGEHAESVFIVKEGRLRAFRMIEGREVVLGNVERGEFVGEMAYINGEPRTANVDALMPCELIEVPVGTLERVLYRRPAWSKTLLTTLARRLKQANNAKLTV